MLYAEFSINFEAITPVTYLGQSGREKGMQEINLLPGEMADDAYWGEIQAWDIDENFPIIPQIVEAMYDSDNLPTKTKFSQKAKPYIKSGLIKVKILDDEDYVTQLQGGNEKVLDMFRQDDNKITASEDTKTKITALGDVMEFQSKLNSAIKQRYQLLNTNYDLLPEWMKKFPPNYSIKLSGVGGRIHDEFYEDYPEDEELPFYFYVQRTADLGDISRPITDEEVSMLIEQASAWLQTNDILQYCSNRGGLRLQKYGIDDNVYWTYLPVTRELHKIWLDYWTTQRSYGFIINYSHKIPRVIQ